MAEKKASLAGFRYSFSLNTGKISKMLTECEMQVFLFNGVKGSSCNSRKFSSSDFYGIYARFSVFMFAVIVFFFLPTNILYPPSSKHMDLHLKAKFFH